MTKNANPLGVFDFSEEDGIPEMASRRYLEIFKNPNSSHPMSKYHVLECVAQGSESVNKGISGLPCVDVDGIECDNGVGNALLGAVREGIGATKERNSDFIQASENCVPDDVCSNLENYQTKNSFMQPESRVLFHEGPSLEKNELECVPSDSPSCREPVDVNLDGDKIMNVGSPATAALVDAESGSLNSDTSNDDFDDSKTVNINIMVDYILYRGNCCPGCVVTFSCNGIKINGSIACGGLETLSLEKEIDDIVRIESQHIQRFQNVIVKLSLLSKDVMQTNDAYGVSGIEELEFVLLEPNWSKKLEEITSLNTKYMALWNVAHEMDVGTHLLQQRPYFPRFNEAFEDVVYPKGDSDAVSLSKRDVDLLRPETFINDTLIDFYIKYLKNQIPPEKKHRFHFFNSFFFRKLADLDKDPSSASDGRAAFLRVQKWTRKVDIFGVDYIFVPVNFNLHWSLLIFCHLGEVASLKDEDAGKPLRVPCILHMDSIKGTHAGLKDLVQSYLWEEWKERHKQTSEELSSKFLNLRFVSLELPQQENSYDCGLFLLHYLELFLAEAPMDFSPFSIHKHSKFLNLDWFPPSEASLKRAHIQRLILDLLENRSRELSSDCSDEPEHGFSECNQKESGVMFVSERCTSPLARQRNLSSSQPGQGIEITLLEPSSMRSSQCVNDHGLVLRELFDPGAAGGSLLAQCSSFGQQSAYFRHNVAMPPIEDDAETGEQFVYFPSGDSVFQQIQPQADSMPYSIRGFGAHSSWNSGISDDSDVGIIEDCNVEFDTALFQKERTDQRRSQSMEHTTCLTKGLPSASHEMFETSDKNVAKNLMDDKGATFEDARSCLTEGLASASHEMLETTATEDPQDLVNDKGTTAKYSEGLLVNDGADNTHNGNEKGNLASCQENQNPKKSLNEEHNIVENGLHEDLTAALHEEPKPVENGSHKDLITLHDDPKLVENELHKEGENAVVADDGTEPCYDVIMEEDEEQAAKRLRLTPILEGEEGANGSLSNFHL